jgi:hypothetical protein
MNFKKSQQLSMDFLVKFILGIVLFAMGVALLWMIFGQARSLAETPQRDIDNRLFALNCDPRQPICVGASTLNMKPGDNYLVDVKLYNNYEHQLTAHALIQLVDEENPTIPTTKYQGNIDLLPQQIPDIIIPAKGNTEFSILVALSKRAPLGSYAIRINLDRGGAYNLPDINKRINLYID